MLGMWGFSGEWGIRVGQMRSRVGKLGRLGLDRDSDEFV